MSGTSNQRRAPSVGTNIKCHLELSSAILKELWLNIKVNFADSPAVKMHLLISIEGVQKILILNRYKAISIYIFLIKL